MYFEDAAAASTSDLAPDAVERTVEAACPIARHTAEDEATGLPDRDGLYKGTPPDLDLFHPWGLEVEEAIEIARRSEAAALAVDKRITNSEGATVSSYDSDFILANSRGFSGEYSSSYCSLSTSPVAKDGESMERDYWYTTHRNPAKLDPAEAVDASRARARFAAWARASSRPSRPR